MNILARCCRLVSTVVLSACLFAPGVVAQGVDLGGLPDYLFFFADGRQDANWQAASKGYAGDVAVNGDVANERTSGHLAFAGTIVTNAPTVDAFQDIVDDNPGQATALVNQGALIDGLLSDLVAAFQTINGLSATMGYASVSSTSLDGLNRQNGSCETFVINVTSGFNVSSQIDIAGDACDAFVLRWDTDATFSDGYEGEVKFQSGGAIVPGGGLGPANFVHVAGNINASGGGSTPPPPYPQGPSAAGGLIDGASTFSGGGFFTGYWLTTGRPTMAYGSTGLRHGESSSMSNAIFVGGWYTLATKFSLTSGTSGVSSTPPSGPPPPGGDCVECGFGADDANKVSRLTLEYTGTAGVVRVYNNDDVSADQLLFEGFLSPGDSFTIMASTVGRSEFSSKVGFYVGGTSDADKVAEIHTSCSSPVGFGTTEANQEKGEDPNGVADFLVLSGKDKDGNDLCDIPPPPPPGEDCVECGFGADDANKVSRLTLEYTGAVGGVVRVYNNDDVSADQLLFEGFLSPGDSFTIMAATVGRSEFSSKVGFYVDGTSDGDKVAEIHTSCSSPVGFGTTEANQEKGEDPNGVADFLVLSGKDKDGNDLCDIPPPPPPGEDCVECGFGADDANKVSRLTLEYTGAVGGVVRVYNNDDVSADQLLFEGFLSPGDSFTTMAATVGRSEFSSKVGFYVDGVKVAEIHTSCSSPVIPGETTEANQEKGEDPNGVADFLVIGGVDKDGKALCVDDVCLIDQGPPQIMYSFEEDRFIVIDVTDDTGIASIDIELADTQGGTVNLVLVDSTFTPGAMTARFKYRLTNFTQNTFIRVVATDLCDQQQCPDTDQFPDFSPSVVINGQGDFATGEVQHPDGLQSLEFFRLINVAVTENTFVPGNPVANFTVTRLDPTMSTRYGLIAATACNATVIDPDLSYSGTGARGDGGMASFEVGSSLLDAMRGDAAASDAVDTALPGAFSVGQNYPNPFHVSTTIGVDLPEATDVRLEVYNLLGQRIAIVADGLYEAGSHAFSFDARDLPSGTYIYRIVTPESSVARRLVVLN